MKKIIAIDVGNSETTVGVGNSDSWVGYPVVSVDVTVEEKYPDCEGNDSDSLVSTLNRIDADLDQLRRFINNDSFVAHVVVSSGFFCIEVFRLLSHGLLNVNVISLVTAIFF